MPPNVRFGDGPHTEIEDGRDKQEHALRVCREAEKDYWPASSKALEGAPEDGVTSDDELRRDRHCNSHHSTVFCCRWKFTAQGQSYRQRFPPPSPMLPI